MNRPVILVVVAFLANAMAAMAGGGVGLIQLPLLLFLGLPYAQALATHKVASVALGVGATSRYRRSGLLSGRFAGFMLLSGLPGVFLGALGILAVPPHMARLALGFLTTALGVYSLRSHDLGQVASPHNRDPRGFAIGGLGLFVIGLLNGSITSGTGLFCTLWLVRWFGFDYKAAVAYTLILVGLVWNATGAATLGSFGDIQWTWLPWLLLGAVTGSYTGAHLGLAASNRWIKRAYEVLTIGVGLRLLT